MSAFSTTVAVEPMIRQGCTALESDVPNPEWYGETYLHHAATVGDADVVARQLASGADANAKDRFDQTPLHRAANASVVRELVRGGSKIEATDSNGFTPVWVAIRDGREETAHALIDSGASVDVRDASGRTLLHLAVERGVMSIIERLAEQRKLVEAVDKDKNTALHLLASGTLEGGRALVISALLIASGCNRTARDSRGMTAQEIARERNKHSLARELGITEPRGMLRR